jgi:hypothetical protein
MGKKEKSKRAQESQTVNQRTISFVMIMIYFKNPIFYMFSVKRRNGYQVNPSIPSMQQRILTDFHYGVVSGFNFIGEINIDLV